MPVPHRYEPPILVLFGDPGHVPICVGTFTCSEGTEGGFTSCSAGWAAVNSCGSGCTADKSSCVTGNTNKGCVNGYSATGTGLACNSGTSGPFGGGCGLTVCCSGGGGSSTWTSCIGGEGHIGACITGEGACGEVCLTYDFCNPPS